ncbi:MAG: restriction endonuclease subunit S [Planctomycetaceae bacterium]|nr:restriction endonuclease subunit S [Planctomycetaceae bacterium]
MSFPRYPKYKASGVDWLGDVPEHWEVKPVKILASIVNGYPFDSNLFDTAEGFPLVRIRDLDKVETETYYKGEFIESAAITADDVLIGMDGDFNVGRWRGQGRALLNQRMCCVRGKSNLLTRLLEYSLPIRLKAINDLTYATTVKHLASSQVEKSLMAIPPDTAEQAQIATFLDRETAKIDGLVAEQQRLIELLKEKRTAVISHAITKGLNPDAPLKPSSIEWLGDVPEHWEIKRLKFLCNIQTGDKDTENAVEDGLYPFFVRSQTVERINSTAFDCEAILTAGDGVGVGKVFHYYKGPFDFHQRVYMMNDFRDVSGPFLFHFLRENFYKVALEGGAKSTVDSLRRPVFMNFPVCVPPREEQTEIVATVEQEAAQFDALAAEAQHSIDLLQERRTAIISAATTGQIDVRPLNKRQSV